MIIKFVLNENSHNFELLELCENISHVMNNIAYSLTLLYVWKNCAQYNKMVNLVSNFFKKYPKIRNKQICVETNFLTISYNCMLIYAALFSFDELTMNCLLLILNVLLVWFFCGVSVGIIYVRYLIVIFNKYLNHLAYKVKKLFSNNQIDQQSHQCAIRNVDKLCTFKDDFNKIFGSQVTVYLINVVIQISIICYYVCMLNRYEQPPLKEFFNFFTYFLPDVVVLCMFVSSINQFAGQVRFGWENYYMQN